MTKKGVQIRFLLILETLASCNGAPVSGKQAQYHFVGHTIDPDALFHGTLVCRHAAGQQGKVANAK